MFQQSISQAGLTSTSNWVTDNPKIGSESSLALPGDQSRSHIWAPLPETMTALALLIAGGTHGWLAQDAWGDAHYKGALFGFNALFSLIFALNLVRGDWLIGWLGGALICASSVLAYVASRTVGLPTLPAEPAAWIEPLSVLSMLAEVGFLIVFMRAFVYNDEKDQL